MAAKPIQHPKRNPFNGNIFEQEIIMFLSCSIYNPIKNQNKTWNNKQDIVQILLLQSKETKKTFCPNLSYILHIQLLTDVSLKNTAPRVAVLLLLSLTINISDNVVIGMCCWYGDAAG